MSEINSIVKKYSTKALFNILENQANAYSSSFLNEIKEELLIRGESFPLDADYIKDIAEMSDINLKTIVEKDWNNYALEYVQIARNEYLKRGFKNENNYEVIEDKFKILKSIASFTQVLAWIIAIAAAIYFYITIKIDITFALVILFYGVIAVLGLFTSVEIIKLFLQIEKNTRDK